MASCAAIANAQQTKKIANDIAKNAPIAVKNAKKAINEGMQVNIDKAIEIEENLFGDCFDTDEQRKRMDNFLNKNKKTENKENKEVQKNLKSKDDNQNKVPLLPTDKFKNMVYLKEFLTPQTPAILTAGDKDSYNSMAIEWGLIGVVWKMSLSVFSSKMKDIHMNL